MALEKVLYEDKKVVITAKNMNAIQDAIIDLERTAAEAVTEAAVVDIVDAKLASIINAEGVVF